MESLTGDNFGAFVISRLGVKLFLVVSDGDEWPFPPPAWEHASITLSVKRTPHWAEMCWVREQLWDAEDLVLQIHPPRSEYVNLHEYALHLWRPIDYDLPRPPRITV